MSFKIKFGSDGCVVLPHLVPESVCSPPPPHPLTSHVALLWQLNFPDDVTLSEDLSPSYFVPCASF